MEKLGDNVPDDVQDFYLPVPDGILGYEKELLLYERQWNKKKRRYAVFGYLLPNTTFQNVYKKGWSSIDNPGNYNRYEREIQKLRKLLRDEVTKHHGNWKDDYGCGNGRKR
jgi:hypothetical protein